MPTSSNLETKHFLKNFYFFSKKIPCYPSRVLLEDQLLVWLCIAYELLRILIFFTTSAVVTGLKENLSRFS